MVKILGGPGFLGSWSWGSAGRRGSRKEVRGSRRWHRRSGEGEDGRLEVLSGKWVHIKVVGDMGKTVGNMRPIGGRRWA